VDGYQAGQTLTVDLFKPGELVDVTGVRKGRGFQGGIKRHGWTGGEASHGSMFHRAPGSIGASSDPSRVFPGHRLPGRMGATRVTTPHLEVVRVLPEQHLLVIKGAVPGATGGLLLVRKSVKESKAQRGAKKKA
jgi:large subunit ribosomal protein L3